MRFVSVHGAFHESKPGAGREETYERTLGSRLIASTRTFTSDFRRSAIKSYQRFAEPSDSETPCKKPFGHGPK